MHSQPYLELNDRGKWEIRWSERDPSGRGKTRSRNLSTRTADRSEAERILNQWVKDRDAALEIFVDPTVTEVVEAYLRAGGPKGRLHTSTRQILARLQRGSLGPIRPMEIQGKPLREWRAQRLSEVQKSTVRRELLQLQGVLNWAAHKERGIIDPTAVPQIVLPEADPVEKRFLDETAEAEFLALALRWGAGVAGRRGFTRKWPQSRVGLYTAIGLNTGARKEAIEELLWQRVDLKARLVDFRVPGRPASNNKLRVPVPINDRLLPILETVPLAERWGPVIGGSIRNGFASFVATTPWPWVTSHIFRHTFITLALRAGVDIWKVSELTGDTPTTIIRHYGHHLADSALHAAANKRFR